MLGIIGAMDTEVAKLKELMTEVDVTQAASMEFYQGKLNGREAVVVRAGIGKVNAACCTQIMIDHFPVRCVINTGIAGSLRAEIDIGDIVLATDAIEHDMDVAVFGYAPGQVPGLDVDAFAADANLRQAAKESCIQVNPDMEGAAIAHVAYLNKVPFLIVRAISDKADDSAEVDYPTFEKKAIEHSVRLITDLAGRI